MGDFTGSSIGYVGVEPVMKLVINLCNQGLIIVGL
jgi:hypothetical protein